MNTGLFGEGFPYSNFHDLNMDWIIKIAKDFLDQYTHLQETIANGEESLQNLTTSGLEQLQTKANDLEALLQQWYNTHSEDIANQLADALEDLNTWYTEHEGYLNQYLQESITAFNNAAHQKATETLASIPSDYTSVANDVSVLKRAFNYYEYDNSIVHPNFFTKGAYYNSANPTPNIDYCYTDLIPVEPSTLYHVYATGGYFVNAYDSNSDYISTIVYGQNTSFTTPANCYFIRVSAHYNRFADLKIWADNYLNSSYKRVLRTSEYEIYDNLTTSILPDLDTAPLNTQYIIQATENSIINGLPSDFIKNGAIAIFTSYEVEYNPVNHNTQGIQTLINYPQGYIWIRSRLYENGVPVTQNWNAWNRFNIGYADIVIGPGQTYTTLREGFNYASAKRNCVVHIMPGTYDLATEFSDVITNHSGTGLFLGNNNTYIFHAGSFVRALFDNTDDWIYDNFEPFHVSSDNNSNFTIENLNIEASNTKYCIHDEMGGEGAAIHKYINCIMVYTNTHTNIKYVQCIGGGLGENTTIEIIGGSYRTINNIGIPSIQNGDPNYSQTPISYHNAYGNGKYSHIFIKDVYLADRGFFRFGGYGESTRNSRIYISNCHCGLPPLVRKETPTAPSINFNTAFWNLDIAIPGSWVLASNQYDATFQSA